MKPTTLVVFALATLFVCGDAFAQRQDNRGFGKGRFLKRLRDDVFGAPDQKKQKSKTPTPAKTKGKTPTPAKDSKPRSQKSSKNDRQTSSKNAKSNPTDFGMQIAKDKKTDLLYVKRIVAKGNAAQAGLKTGDIILEAGGSKLTSQQELDSIVDVLGQGDQLEFKIKHRNDKPRTVMVQYGTAKEVDPEDIESLENSKTGGLKSVLVQSDTSANQVPVQNAKLNSYQRIIRDQRQRIAELEAKIRGMENQRNKTAESEGPALNGPGY